ncbi:hypothetical protein U4E84_08205 [Halorubrum sp. AD140]|uniref:hypothetical protein n=1 Tax=Halorubrum sp. AD140 TaxID=3050073 RepID=UPI002ACC7996|nr:hypothetical protein [Halorubrum sp. AD140]MDZ5811329.1 hypothetical protein [Halorubrum sp. AD140]
MRTDRRTALPILAGVLTAGCTGSNGEDPNGEPATPDPEDEETVLVQCGADA